jgi:hypothetical protein
VNCCIEKSSIILNFMCSRDLLTSVVLEDGILQ